MNDMPNLYALVLQLRPEHGNLLPRVFGHQAQALFFELVRQIDPELSNALHAAAQSKPFTVAVLDRRQETGDMPSPNLASGVSRLASIDLRVTLMKSHLFGPLTQALLRQTTRPAMRLGTTALLLGNVFGTPSAHPLAGFTSFATLHEQAQPTSRVTLQFITPAAFGQGTRADGKARLGLLPTPDAVFGSLARRWNDLCPELLLDTILLEDALKETLIARYRIESCEINLGKGPQKGFVGACTYELPPAPAQARMLALLADSAFYLGIGIKTARGMGLCRRTA